GPGLVVGRLQPEVAAVLLGLQLAAAGAEEGVPGRAGPDRAVVGLDGDLRGGIGVDRDDQVAGSGAPGDIGGHLQGAGLERGEVVARDARPGDRTGGQEHRNDRDECYETEAAPSRSELGHSIILSGTGSRDGTRPTGRPRGSRAPGRRYESCGSGV